MIPIHLLYMARRAGKLELRKFAFAAANYFSGSAKLAIGKCQSDLSYLLGTSGLEKGTLTSEIERWMDSAFANIDYIARTIAKAHDIEEVQESAEVLKSFALRSADFEWDKIGNSREASRENNYFTAGIFAIVVILLIGLLGAGIKYKVNSSLMTLGATIATIAASFAIAVLKKN